MTAPAAAGRSVPRDVLTLTRRSLRLFFRDRIGVFFSLLSAIVLIGLYALFLGQNQIDALAGRYPSAPAGDVRGFIYAWVFAGVAMITSLTTSFSTVGAFVADRASGRFADFLVSPVRRVAIVLGYLLSGLVVAVIVTVLVVVAGQLFLLSQGVPLMTPLEVLRCLGWIALSAAAFSALGSFAVSFLRTQQAFGALSTIVGTVVGFLAGAYIPVGVLPESAQRVTGVLPFAQSAMLIREPMTAGALARLSDGSTAAADAVREFYGVTISVGGTEITPGIAAAELAAVVVVFTLLSVLRLSRGIR